MVMRNLIFALSLVFILYSCKDNGTTPSTPPSPSEYYPLSVGNTWIYSIQDSNLVKGTVTKSDDQIRQIVGTKEIHGKNYFILESYPNNTSNFTKDTAFCRLEDGKFYKLNKDSSEYLYADFTLPIGRTYILGPGNGNGELYKLTTKKAKLNLAAGSFENCITFQHDSLFIYDDATATSKLMVHYAPGIGQVKVELADKLTSKKDTNSYNAATLTLELKYAKINGKEYGKK